MKKLILFSVCMATCILMPGCKKFLTKKSNQALLTPVLLADLQAILDNGIVNQTSPAAGERASDDYYVLYSDWQALSSNGSGEQNMRSYIWGDKIFTPYPNDWGYTYDNIYKANIVLNLIDEMKDVKDNPATYSALKGMAFFIRGKAFLDALIIWAPVYNASSADKDPGIPIRLDPDFEIPTTRSNNKDCFMQVIEDLKSAALLLPNNTIHPLRPNKPAALGLLARSYLYMGSYDSAFKYAALCLDIQNDLFDFNTIPNFSATFPISRFNKEVLYDANMLAPSVLGMSIAKIDSNLYATYDINDLRKNVYFRNNNNGSYAFKGSYSGNNAGFSGVALDEVYLIRAECLAHSGNIYPAIEDLNKLLVKRWLTGTYIPVSASTKEEALAIILLERRKELIMRGLRWMDIKRLNREGYNINLKRILNNNIYELKANDKRFALPIPDDVITMTGIEQN
ncbi:MAG: RagB/SusD family nutrient uptake outer membrane protein [Niabella sp.]